MARLGFKPGGFDGRDFSLGRASMAVAAGEVEEQFILEHRFAARDQQKVPCCVPCAISVAMECLDQLTPPARELSPLYLYWKARAALQKEDVLTELTLRDGFNAAVKHGVAERGLHDVAFDREGALTEPSEEADGSARQRRLVDFDPVKKLPAYFKVKTVTQWKQALRQAMPVVMGFFVTSAYEAITPESPVHGPVPEEGSEAGHCVAVIGYDDQRGAFLAKDSRGANWGDEGRWWLPYEVLDSDLVNCAFALGRIEEKE
ncbi:MAG: C1 family peptidase [Acidobacteria bacterium]|nr:C1 family peptidase [Acidobacteriota bacterium]